MTLLLRPMPASITDWHFYYANKLTIVSLNQFNALSV